MLLFPALLRAQGEPAASDAPETHENAAAGGGAERTTTSRVRRFRVVGSGRST